MLAVLAAAVGALMLMVGSAYLYYRLEWKSLILFAVLIGSMVLVSGRVADLPLVMAPFLLGGVGGYTYKSGKSFEFYLLTTSIVLSVIVSGFFYYLTFYQNVDFVGLLRGELVRVLEMGGAPADIKQQFMAEFDASRNDIIARVPFSSFLNVMVISGLGFLVMGRFLTRTAQAAAVEGLESFRLNDYFIFALIGGLAAYLLIDKSEYLILHSAGLNIALIAALLYFVQALGLIKFFLIKRGLPGYFLPLGLTVMLLTGIWIALFLFIMLAGLGALDVWADFRKRITAGPGNKDTK
ncbi:MAG TPA: DUF2232 domain-containing protein [Spirochaetota bacterium]|nr:DUF2232 domain-containing protein [Spirochaetota bacterium]HPV42606.1 DUF2232 domain-containing protein [Spirochaetota bacterium]